jgi:succinate dehydrogenase / fumarate reductase cytochrome b subunit
MVVQGFRNVYVSTAYIVAMLFLGLHLSHASSSIFQTLGLSTNTSRRTLHRVGVGVALIIMLGNISIPLAISLGLIGLPLEGVTP